VSSRNSGPTTAWLQADLHPSARHRETGAAIPPVRPVGHHSIRPKGLWAIVRLLRSMAVDDPPTTITIRSSTRHLLESIKRPEETYDELLQELAEEYYSPELVRELRRRVAAVRSRRARTIPAAEAYRRLGV
jgi:hypothetical protein